MPGLFCWRGASRPLRFGGIWPPMIAKSSADRQTFIIHMAALVPQHDGSSHGGALI
jgi:hypothetical protein